MQAPKVTVPTGRFGEWAVEQFTIDEEAARFNLYSNLMQGTGHRAVRPGTYTRLIHHGHVIMSDTPAEISDLAPLKAHAQGDVLINGLGLGIAIELIIDQVHCITVVEIDPDIVRTIGGHYLQKYPDKVVIIEADALTFKPRGHYHTVWHDIWPTISTDNLKTMGTLHRKYARKTDWQGSWCKDECLWMRREEGR